ncbi:MAG: TolC family protein [Alistipes sp.]|nr:TolC family protein [Alistipes sp.]
MKRCLMTVTLVITVLTAQAQITLDEYRASVMEYSWTLKNRNSQSEEARENMGRAKTGFLPSLAANGSFSVQFRHIEGVRRWDFALQPQIIQTLYAGGAVRAAWKGAKLDYDIALCNEAFAMLDVRYAADYAYWTLSAMAQYFESVRRYVEIIRSLKEVVDARFAEGYIAKGDVLQIDSRLSEAEYELSVAEQNYSVAMHNFNILRGERLDAEVLLAQTIRDSIPLPSRVPVENIVASRPDYAAADLMRRRAEVAVRSARAPFNPQIGVGVGGGWAPYSPNRTGQTQINGSLFAQVSVPIFHWGERHRVVAAAREHARQSGFAQSQLYDDIMREEMNGWITLVDSNAQVSTSMRSMLIARENLEISTYSYSEGVTTILDVLQAQISWLQLYTNTITAQYNYAVAVSDYERITAR